MKKATLIFCLFWVLSPLIVFPQIDHTCILELEGTEKPSYNIGFAPIGAEWYYGYQEIMEQGYVKITAVNDTVIDGQPCVILEKNRTGVGYYFGYFSHVFGYEYLTMSDDCVMIYRNGAFHKLFDFGAEVGDSWNVPGREDICEQDYGSVMVVDKGTESVNGVNLRFIRIVDDTDSYWGFGHSMAGYPSDTITVFERIGPVDSYLLPTQKCVFDSDEEAGIFRCYSDDVVGNYKSNSYNPNRYCDYIDENHQEVEDMVFGKDVTVSPNPGNTQVEVKAPVEHAVIRFYDLNGKLILERPFNRNTTVGTSSWPQGLYLWEIWSDTRKEAFGKWVKQ